MLSPRDKTKTTLLMFLIKTSTLESVYIFFQQKIIIICIYYIYDGWRGDH